MRKLQMRMILPVLMLFSSIASFADPYVHQPSLDAIHYDLFVEVTDSSDSITGTTKIQVEVRRGPLAEMWLDFKDMSVDRLMTGGVERPFALREGRLAFQLDRTYSDHERIEIEIRYHGKPAKGFLFGKSRYGRRVMFADNWPDNAHYWFPSIDHPSDKATVSFAVTAPEKYSVVAAGNQRKVVALPYKRKLTQWTETQPIPTYCMVLGIAEFSIARSSRGNLPLAWYAYPQDSTIAAAKFRRTPQMLEFFDSTIGPFPYEKLAQVESNIRFGAMENSSAIFYSEPLFGSSSEEPVAHEVAHQWFGDSVTQSDWDHLWLSEGFATYFEALFYEHLNGPESLKQMMSRHAEKIALYKPALDRPVIDPGQTDLIKKLNPLSYEKGAWILHMLRGMLGDEVFFRGIRDYYTQYSGGNASTADFEKTMEAAGQTELSRFFQQWLFQPGWPEYRFSWHWDEASRELEILVRQVQTRGIFDMPVEFRISIKDYKTVHKFRISKAEQTVRVPLSNRPTLVEMDPGNWILKNLASGMR